MWLPSAPVPPPWVSMPDRLVAGDDDAGQDVLPVDAGDELVLFAGHGDSPSFCLCAFG